ncbi:hypothetical protein [Runella salmonicolor]|uniref:Uncharacterized protein n=1 Tax=Runella salmonicolor TaxID=2950278 RepID=A0ABT1FSY8_9BACT|nr:hypothetical protein [Runella salmonicolor]MCP1384836.1 hypothetical protein [Runella salmonicolor]
MPTVTPFDGLVNLKPVDNGTTYVVNDLTGLTPSLIDGLKRSGDLETTTELWTRTKSNAYERLKMDFELELSEKRDFRHEMAETLPPVPDAENAFESYTDFIGGVLEMRYNKHTIVEFNELIIWAEDEGTCVVALYDKMILKELYRSANINITPGINRIDLTQIIGSKKVALFGMELFVGLKTTVRLRPMECNLGFGGPVCDVAGIYSYKVDLDKGGLVYADFVKTSTEWPVHVGIKIVGDVDDLMTVHKTKLASAFRYLCGHLLIVERLKSENFNAFTNTLEEQMKELRDDYHKQYKSQLIKAIKTIYTTTDDSQVQGINTEHQGGFFTGSYV